jgi:hypothetical protein
MMLTCKEKESRQHRVQLLQQEQAGSQTVTYVYVMIMMYSKPLVEIMRSMKYQAGANCSDVRHRLTLDLHNTPPDAGVQPLLCRCTHSTQTYHAVHNSHR